MISGVIIEYLRNVKGLNLIAFSREVKDEKVVLKSGDVVFKKKQCY